MLLRQTAHSCPIGNVDQIIENALNNINKPAELEFALPNKCNLGAPTWHVMPLVKVSLLEGTNLSLPKSA